MVPEIELFDPATNEWKIIDPQYREIQLEIACAVQIAEKSILIFGGVNAMVKDSKKSFLFNTEDFSL